MEQKFAELGQNADGKTSEQQLQDEIAGCDIKLNFYLDGSDASQVFHSEVFKQGQTFEWVKNKVAIKLEAKYQDLELHHNDKRIPEPFCLVDMGISQETTLKVKIAEGAQLGLDSLREQVLKEIEKDAAEEEKQ